MGGGHPGDQSLALLKVSVLLAAIKLMWYGLCRRTCKPTWKLTCRCTRWRWLGGAFKCWAPSSPSIGVFRWNSAGDPIGGRRRWTPTDAFSISFITRSKSSTATNCPPLHQLLLLLLLLLLHRRLIPPNYRNVAPPTSKSTYRDETNRNPQINCSSFTFQKHQHSRADLEVDSEASFEVYLEGGDPLCSTSVTSAGIQFLFRSAPSVARFFSCLANCAYLKQREKERERERERTKELSHYLRYYFNEWVNTRFWKCQPVSWSQPSSIPRPLATRNKLHLPTRSKLIQIDPNWSNLIQLDPTSPSPHLPLISFYLPETSGHWMTNQSTDCQTGKSWFELRYHPIWWHPEAHWFGSFMSTTQTWSRHNWPN